MFQVFMVVWHLAGAVAGAMIGFQSGGIVGAAIGVMVGLVGAFLAGCGLVLALPMLTAAVFTIVFAAIGIGAVVLLMQLF